MDNAWISAIVTWAYFVLVAFALTSVLLRKRETASALGWSLAIVFLPFFGLWLYFLVGWNRTSRLLHRKILHRRTFPTSLRDSTSGEPVDDHSAAPPAEKWSDIERMLAELGQAPRRTGNRFDLFAEGADAFEAMESAIRAARHHVHVEFFIFRDDQLGRRATEMLVAKAREGVEVRVIVDGVGSRGNRRLLRAIRDAGGEGARFLPVRLFGKATPHLRNHRKIVICDGEVAFFGGLNIGVEYLGRRFRRNRGRDWYDLHARLEGPAVWDLQEIFLEDWDFANGSSPEPDPYFPDPQHRGDSSVQILAGGPDQPVNAIRQTFLAAFYRARRSIRIFTPYLVPDLGLRDALQTAARSGVSVEIITQWPPADHLIVHLCSEYLMHELLQSGVRIHGFAEGMMHAKAVCVDEEWAMLGTANLDNRSLHLNFEQMTIVDGAAEVATIEAAFAETLARCEEYTLGGLASRPAGRQLLSNAARLLAPIL